MEMNTKYFGTIEYEKKDLITLTEGLAGIGDYREYLPISFEEGSDSMLCLQCRDVASLAFVAVNPFGIVENYHPVLNAEDKSALGFREENELSFYALCTLRDTLEHSTVNLKAPIAVNVKTRRAKQVIVETDYMLRYPLKAGGQRTKC